jgi:TatD DNase family protein
MQRYEFIDIHTHKFYDDGTIFLYSRSLWRDPEPPAGTLFSAGMHPWNASVGDLDAVLEYLEAAPLAAVGEVGLDYATEIPREVQNEVFRRQLEVAEKRGLPVVIHCVRAFYDVISQLKEHDLRAVVFHGFTGSPQEAAEAVKRGYYLSFNERSLASPKTVESLRQVPVASIFAETDTASEHVSKVYEMIAEARGVAVGQLKPAIADNFNRIFR